MFTLGSILCGASTSLLTLIAARIFQAGCGIEPAVVGVQHGTGRDLAVVVSLPLAQTEVPLADHAGRVTGLLQQRGQREILQPAGLGDDPRHRSLADVHQRDGEPHQPADRQA